MHVLLCRLENSGYSDIPISTASRSFRTAAGKSRFCHVDPVSRTAVGIMGALIRRASASDGREALVQVFLSRLNHDGHPYVPFLTAKRTLRTVAATENYPCHDEDGEERSSGRKEFHVDEGEVLMLRCVWGRSWKERRETGKERLYLCL